MEYLASLGLDPQLVTTTLAGWGGRVLAALAIFVIGRWVALALAGWFRRAVERAQADTTLSRFLANLIYMVLTVFVVLTALSALGVPTMNFLAILGAAGLAVGLAVKDSLSNFSSGVMLVFFKPFKVGHYVEAAGVAGTVEHIGIFNAVLKTPDNRIITIPNGLIYGDTITNYSAEQTRRIDLMMSIGYDDDIARARELIRGVLDAESRILEEPAPTIMLMALGESSVDIAVRPWVASADYWAVRAELLEKIKLALEGDGMSIPYPQRDLHIVSGAASSA